MNSWHSMRVSDAERERAADVVKAAAAEGRLTWDEHNDRLGQVYRAQTHGELQPVVSDLPVGASPAPQSPTPLKYAPVQPWAPSAPAPPVKTNELAIASMVLGGLGFMVGVTAIPAVITGHMSLNRLRNSAEEGRGLAIAGLVMGYAVSAGIALLMIMFFILMIASV